MELTKEFRFEASHVLPRHPGKCSRLHGHSWILRVSLSGVINRDTGFVMDYAEMSQIVKPLIDKLDHRHLGAQILTSTLPENWLVPGLPLNFYPSSENLLVWIALQLHDLAWSRLTLEETCTSSAELTREEYDGAEFNKK